MRRYLSALLLGAALSAPLAIRATADDHPNRYYDRDHKDYHEWNDREERAYRKFLAEKRRAQHDWRKASKAEQREYWRWRHEHPE